MIYERMLDEDLEPSERKILDAIGTGGLWLDLKEYIDQSYDFLSEEWQDPHFSFS